VGETPQLDRYFAQRVQRMTVSEIRALFTVASRPEIISLAGGMPAVEALPLAEIADLTSRVIRDHGAKALQYGSGQGDPRLRELICDVMAAEGITGSPENIVVTFGSQQALQLLALTCLDPGDVVLTEGPSYVGALGVFAAAQAEVTHVAIDADGVIPAALREALDQAAVAGRRVKFFYTVPNFQNPTGVTLSEPRRDALLELADEYDFIILEDNPYGLLGFDGGPLRAIRARDSDRVVYFGSFSKTFAAGVRTGWALAPAPLCEKLILANEASVLSHSLLNQMVVTAYLEYHPWQEQLRQFQSLYRTRRDATLSALEKAAVSGLTWTRPGGGFYVWATLPEGLDSKHLMTAALAEKVAYVPGVGFYADGMGQRELRLSYCYATPERIQEGIQRLSGVITRARNNDVSSSLSAIL
jgi:2-aminoadipate transaminase